MRVHQILSVKGNTLFTTTPNARLSEAVKTMAEQDIGSLVVLDQGTLVGMLTFREVVHILAKRQAENRSGPTPPVSEIFVSEVYKSKMLKEYIGDWPAAEQSV